MKIHAAIAQILVDHGVEVMFGLAGDANLYMIDSFARALQGTYVAATHEANAVLMALGYASISGKVGVATVTHGPGLTNTVTALVEGVKGQIPLVLLCGDTGAEDKDNMQNIPQREVIVATGAGFEQLRSPKTLNRDLATALRRAVVERRPIAFNMPSDFQWLDVDYLPARHKVPENRALVPAGDDLDNAVGIIAAAKRPIILAGRGATSAEAREAILRLAQRTDALLATTLKGKDLFRGEDFDLGVFGTISSSIAVDAIIESDCILAFGASLNPHTTSHGSFLKGKRIVQVNLEATEIGKSYEPTIGVVGDPALVADNFVHWLDAAEIPPSGYRNEAMRQKLRDFSPLQGMADRSTSDTIDIRQAMQRLNDAVPANRILVTDGGRMARHPWRLIQVQDPRSFITTLNSGSIGLGMAYAIGASYAAPNRPILMVSGDGGFMLGGLAEFHTAAHCRRDLIVVLCNDGSYGAEHIQFRRRNMDPAMSLFKWPEFADVANSLGGRGIAVRNHDDLQRAVQAIAERDGPLLIDLKLDPDNVTNDDIVPPAAAAGNRT